MRDFDLGLLKPVVSDLSGFEIAGAPPHVQGVYAKLSTVAEQVATTAEVEDLLAHYEAKAIIGPRYRNDMQHIALATVYGVDVLVSWNFKHMLRSTRCGCSTRPTWRWDTGNCASTHPGKSRPMTQKQTIDTMQMVREIRDRINEQTSHMTSAERTAYIRRNGEEANRRFQQAGESVPTHDATPKG